jgi:hypothetical protein
VIAIKESLIAIKESLIATKESGITTDPVLPRIQIGLLSPHPRLVAACSDGYIQEWLQLAM